MDWWERLHRLIYEAVGALSPNGLVRETPLINLCGRGALSPDGLVGEINE